MNLIYPTKSMQDKACRLTRSFFMLNVVFLLGVSGAHAALVTWYLDGVTFNTATTANGSFDFDVDANAYSNININVTKDGNTNMYVVLNPGTGSNAHAMNTVTQLQPDQTGLPHLKLLFDSPLTNAGGSINITAGISSYQGFCQQAGCSTFHSPFDDVTAGQVTTTSPVPLPPAMLLFGSGLIALIGLNRKRKKT